MPNTRVVAVALTVTVVTNGYILNLDDNPLPFYRCQHFKTSYCLSGDFSDLFLLQSLSACR